MKETQSCDACGVAEPATQQAGNYIDYGWSFLWPDLGHYGGFTDSFLDAPHNHEEAMVHLCHDCCVKFLELFPRLVAKMRVQGGHPNRNEHDSDNGIGVPPCCPYAWTWVVDSPADNPRKKTFTHYRATRELTWEIVAD